MPDAAPTARDIDRVTGLDGPVKTRESGQEAHRKRRRIAEAEGWRLADGEELACDGIAAFASAPAPSDPAAITVQIGHGGHRVADGYATHTVAHGDHHASEVKTENDGGPPSHQHHSAEGTVLDQMAEGFGGVAELIGSFGRVEGEMIACLLVRTSAPPRPSIWRTSGLRSTRGRYLAATCIAAQSLGSPTCRV